MRVAFLDQFSELGGAQLCLRDVLIESKRRGWEAILMAPGDGPLLRFAKSLGYETAPLPMTKYANGGKSATDFLRFGPDIVRCGRIVRRTCSELAVDLIYVNGPRLLPVIVHSRIPVLFHSHSLLATKYSQAIARWALGERTGIVACSQFIGRSLNETVCNKPVQVIYNGVSDCGFQPRTSASGPIKVGILGRISAEKGPLDFIRAATLLADRRKFEFVVIGAALFSEMKYERDVRKMGAAAGVEFRGWTDNVGQALHDLDILAVPSASAEASSRVVIEAFSAGAAVVAYPVGGIPELVRSGHNGVLTEARSAESLAKNIQTLAGEAGLRLSLIENARKDWAARFTVERFQREVCERMMQAAGMPAPCANGIRCAPQAEAYARDESPASL